LKKWVFIALISSSVVLLDYVTKKIIVAKVMPHEVINVLPFLRIVNVRNTGAAFGLLSNVNNNVFIFISLFAIVVIILYLSKISKVAELFSLSLILGGAIGNLIDRITIGKVIDFIDFFVGKWHWPAFNIADSALTVGIILFIWANLRHGRHSKI
jgi:signal peptidase II